MGYISGTEGLSGPLSQGHRHIPGPSCISLISTLPTKSPLLSSLLQQLGFWPSAITTAANGDRWGQTHKEDF